MGSLPAFQIKGARDLTLFDGREKSIEDGDKKVTCFIFKRKEKSAKKIGRMARSQRRPNHEEDSLNG